MKKAIFTTVIIISLMLGHITNIHATPQEFLNCSKESFSFSDLKYYSKGELVKGYCACVSYAEFSTKQSVNLLHQQTLYIQMYGVESHQYRDSEAEYYKYSGLQKTASSNASRIARTLKKDHQYPNAPKCEAK